MSRLFASVLFISSIYLVSSVPSFYYEEMCKNEVFDFENQKVNGYYRLDLNYTLHNLSKMLLPEDLKFETWGNETELKVLQIQKEKFNKLIEDFYLRPNFDRIDSSTVYLHKKAVLKIWSYFSSFKSKIGFGELSSYYKIDSIIKTSVEFFHDVLSLKSDLLAPNLINKNEFKEIIFAIKKQMDLSNKSFVFENHASHFYFNKRLIQTSWFNVDFKLFTCKAYFTLFVPIFDKNSPKLLECKKVKSLPAFFNQL